jgi:hypothetical protein
MKDWLHVPPRCTHHLNSPLHLYRVKLALPEVYPLNGEKPMQSPSYRRMVWVLVLLLVAIVAVTPSSVVLAQAPPGQTAQAPSAPHTETGDDDDSGKWGLAGLLGLLGLAGLMRHDRTRPIDRTD